MPEPEALKGFQVGISRFLDFSSLVDNTTHHDYRVSYLQPVKAHLTTTPVGILH